MAADSLHYIPLVVQTNDRKWGVLRNTGFHPGWVSGRSLPTPFLRGFKGLHPSPAFPSNCLLSLFSEHTQKMEFPHAEFRFLFYPVHAFWGRMTGLSLSLKSA